MDSSFSGQGQYVKYGEIKYPAELVSSTVLGGVAGPFAAEANIYGNIAYGSGFSAGSTFITNEYYGYDRDHNESLLTAGFFGGLGAGLGKYLDSWLISKWIGGIPQLVNSPSYNPALGALLNSSNPFLTNQRYTQSVLIKDVLSGFAGSGSETILKETFNNSSPSPTKVAPSTLKKTATK